MYSVSPASVQQGDTVLLTVEGKNLPTGTVVVEFFPQQIAVLNILSAEADELIIQVKVPNMAPPGQYNILIFNHLGQEAFGQAVLNVGSDLVTPIFDEHDPKTISDATDGFAVMMTGTLITQEAVNQLEMNWYIGDELMKGLNTEFAMAGQSTVVCAISGKLVGGTLRGRVLLNKIPIYMVDIKLQLDRAMLIGVTPSIMDVDQLPYQFKLLGMGVTQGYVDTLAVVLRSEGVSVEAATIEFLDEASVVVTFIDSLLVGDHTLEVTAGGVPEYGGVVTIEESKYALLETGLTDENEGESGEPVVEPNIDTLSVEDPAHDDPGFEGETTVEEVLPLGYILSLVNKQLTPGSNPARLDVKCSGIQAEVFERLEAKLRVGMDLAELTLVSESTGDASFTYVFTPDDNGWIDGQTGTLEIIDPLDEIKTFRTIVTVGIQAETTTGSNSSEYENNESWDVISARVVSTFSGQQLVVDIIPPDEDASIDAVSCTYTVIPKELGIEDSFEGLDLKGELQLSIEPSGSIVANVNGRFVEGDLIVKLTDDMGASWLATLPLAAPQLSATLKVPTATQLTVNPTTGSVEPAWLRWECRFSGIKPIDPEVFTLKSSTDLPEAEILKVLLPDNGVALEIEFSGVAKELAEEDEIEFWLDSSTNFNFDKSSRVSITIHDASAKPVDSVLLVQDSPVVITLRGFEVKYKLADDLDPKKISEVVKASSSMLLLDWNLAGFDLQTDILSLPAGSILTVKFIRDPITLDEPAYSQLITELVGIGLVGLNLSWPDSGIMVSCQVQFTQ